MLERSENLKSASEKSTIKPVIIAEVVIDQLLDQVNTRSEWDACTLSNIDTTTKVGYAQLDNENVTEIDASGTDTSTYITLGGSGASYDAVAVKLDWSVKQTQQLKNIRLYISSVGLENRTCYVQIRKGGGPANNYSEQIYKKSISNVNTTTTYIDHSVTDTVLLELGNIYWLLVKVPHSLPDTEIRVKTDNNDSSYVTKKSANSGHSYMNVADTHILFKIDTKKYYNTGTITANLDLGSVPTSIGRWNLFYTEEPGSLVTFDAYYSDNAVDYTLIGSVGDGDSITDLHRYYRILATLTPSADRLNTPRVDLMRANLNNAIKYSYGSKSIFGYPNHIGSVSDIKTSVSAHGFVNKVSGLDLEILDYGAELVETLKNNVIHKHYVYLYFGLNDSKLSESDFISLGVYEITNYSYDKYSQTVNLYCDNVLSEISKAKRPTETEVDAGLGSSYKYGNSAWDVGYNDLYKIPDIIYDLLKNKLEIPANQIDESTFDTLAADPIVSTILCKRFIDKPEEVKKMLTELCQLISSYLIITEKGVIKLVRYDSTDTAVEDIQPSDIINDSFKISNPEENIINRVQTRYGWDGNGEDFSDWEGTIIRQDNDAYVAYGSKYFDYEPLKSFWLGPAANYNGDDSATTISDEILERYKFGAPEIDFSTDIKFYYIQVGDLVTITHPNYVTYGSTEINNAKFFILEKKLNIEKGTINWKAIRAKTPNQSEGASTYADFLQVYDSYNVDWTNSSTAVSVDRQNTTESAWVKIRYTLDNPSDYGGLLTISGTNAYTGTTPNLYVSDNVDDKIYIATYSGTELAEYTTATLSGTFTAPYGMTQDVDGSLWVCNNTGNAATAGLVNLGQGMAYNTSILTSDICGTDIRDISIASDGTYWVAVSGTNIVNLDRTNTIVDTITNTDISATSIDGVACDWSDNTLWVVDNSIHKLHHINTDGSSIAKYSATTFISDKTTLNSCDATTGWNPTWDIFDNAVSLNTTTKIEGTGAINLIKADTEDSFEVYVKQISGFDGTGKTVHAYFYVKDTTTLNKITSLDTQVGTFVPASDYTNYYHHTFAVASLVVGWNLLSFYISDGTVAASPTLNSLSFIGVQVLLNNPTDTLAAGDLIMDYWFTTTSCLRGIDCDVAGDYLHVVDSSANAIYKLNAVDCTLDSTITTTNIDATLVDPYGIAINKVGSDPSSYTCEIRASLDGVTYDINLGTFTNGDTIIGNYKYYEIYFLMEPTGLTWYDSYYRVSVDYTYG